MRPLLLHICSDGTAGLKDLEGWTAPSLEECSPHVCRLHDRGVGERRSYHLHDSPESQYGSPQWRTEQRPDHDEGPLGPARRSADCDRADRRSRQPRWALLYDEGFPTDWWEPNAIDGR